MIFVIVVVVSIKRFVWVGVISFVVIDDMLGMMFVGNRRVIKKDLFGFVVVFVVVVKGGSIVKIVVVRGGNIVEVVIVKVIVIIVVGSRIFVLIVIVVGGGGSGVVLVIVFVVLRYFGDGLIW